MLLEKKYPPSMCIILVIIRGALSSDTYWLMFYLRGESGLHCRINGKSPSSNFFQLRF